MINIASEEYRKGYNFQNRVKRFGEKLGYVVVCQPKSSFPDQVWIPLPSKKETIPRFVECKIKTGLDSEKVTLPKLLSKQERHMMKDFLDKGFYFSVAFKTKERGDIWFLEVIDSDIVVLNEKQIELSENIMEVIDDVEGL